ncbi:MAG TPA: hypothetical protein VNW94_10665 [Streptosporangiaceae bacterium]|nr:hypothetical protein [Streptosporangiaceae bacterium]
MIGILGGRLVRGDCSVAQVASLLKTDQVRSSRLSDHLVLWQGDDGGAAGVDGGNPLASWLVADFGHAPVSGEVVVTGPVIDGRVLPLDRAHAEQMSRRVSDPAAVTAGFLEAVRLADQALPEEVKRSMGAARYEWEARADRERAEATRMRSAPRQRGYGRPPLIAVLAGVCGLVLGGLLACGGVVLSVLSWTSPGSGHRFAAVFVLLIAGLGVFTLSCSAGLLRGRDDHAEALAVPLSITLFLSGSGLAHGLFADHRDGWLLQIAVLFLIFALAGVTLLLRNAPGTQNWFMK